MAVFVAMLGGIAYGAVLATRRRLSWAVVLGTGAVYLTAVAAILLLSNEDVGTPMIVLVASTAGSFASVEVYLRRERRERSGTD